MIKTAVIGAGMMGLNHIRILSEISNLVGVSDNFEDNLKRANKYTNNLYKDYKEMIEKEKPDMVSIVVPTKLHTQIALDLLDKNINILIEKPIADTIENAKKIIEKAKEKDVKVMIGHIERFNPAIQELKKEIENGKLGKPFKVNVQRIGPFPSRIRDVGVVIDLAVHDLDIIRYILQDEVKRVYAQTENKIHTEHEDLLSAILRTNNNTICNIDINWLTPRKIRKIQVVGEKGMFVADYLKRSLYFYENDYINTTQYSKDAKVFGINEGKMIKYNTKDQDLLTQELTHFIDCIENNKEPLVSAQDGLKALELAYRILESANENV